MIPLVMENTPFPRLTNIGDFTILWKYKPSENADKFWGMALVAIDNIRHGQVLTFYGRRANERYIFSQIKSMNQHQLIRNKILDGYKVVSIDDDNCGEDVLRLKEQIKQQILMAQLTL